jgi:hypothetical protein
MFRLVGSARKVAENEVVEICFSISETFYLLKSVAMVVLAVTYVSRTYACHCFQ